MKTILSRLSLEAIQKNITLTSKRFPIATLAMILTALCLFTLVHANLEQILEKNIISIVVSLIMTFFFSIAIDLNSESRWYTPLKKYLFQALPILFGIFFFFTFHAGTESFENMVFLFLSLAGIMSFLFFAPYLKNIALWNGEQNSYYAYFYKIATLFLVSTILGWLLFALWAIAIWTIETLFWLGIYNNVYGDWSIIAMIIFTPLFALQGLPQKSEFNEAILSQNAFFSFLTRYVAIPFVVIYFLILYAYSIKVLLNFGDWPKWEVSWMVIGFSILWYMTYIFSYSFEAKNKFIARFRKYFPYTVVPQVAMLFYAIYLRIAQYDITINRYFVVVFGLWLLIISLYFIISKKKYLGNIAALLTLFTIIVSVWPWWVYSLPESRQLARLEHHLAQANILQDNSIIPLKDSADIDEKLSGEIYNWIDYLCDFDDCNSIKKLFKEQYETIVTEDKKEFTDKKLSDVEYYQNNDFNLDNTQRQEEIDSIENRKYEWPNKWNIVSKLTDILKVKEFSNNWDLYIHPYKYFAKSDSKLLLNTSIDGYKEIIELRWNINSGRKKYGFIDVQTKTISIYESDALIDTIDASTMITFFINQDDSKSKYWQRSDFNSNDMVFELKWKIHEVKAIIEYISVPNPKYNWKKEDHYINKAGYLLIK